MRAPFVIERHAEADSFLANAENWLLEAEPENNLLLGIALGHRGQRAADLPHYWVSVHEANRIVGCACRTPPHGLVLTRVPARAIAQLVEDVGVVYPSLNGVNGPTGSSEAFAGAWVARHGGTSWTRFRLRLHELAQVSLVSPHGPGRLRKAIDEDLPLARQWMDEFVRDVRLPPAQPDLAQHLIARGQLFFWLDAESPRAMVAATRETRSGCAINTVYTPPQFRRRGYATAAVAKLSERLLDTGRRFCCLYTDLANPTSNSIYAKIGYRPIRDDTEIAFEAASQPVKP